MLLGSTYSTYPHPSPTITITITHHKGSSVLPVLPDTGANVTVVVPEYLHSLGLSTTDFQPPPADPRYTADGLSMTPALGSLQAEVSVKQKTTTVWIDVHEGIPSPLLSRHTCREFAIIPDRFPQPIANVTHANVCAPEGARTIPPPPLPFTADMSHTQARAYFLKEYRDVLVSKADLRDAPLRPMTGPPMKIHLRKDANPFVIHSARQIPLAFRDVVKTEPELMVTQGIIAPTGDEPSP